MADFKSRVDKYELHKELAKGSAQQKDNASAEQAGRPPSPTSLKPQKGVNYFIIGSSAKLREGDLRKSEMTAYGNDSDYAFMLIEIAGTSCIFRPQRQGCDARFGHRATVKEGDGQVGTTDYKRRLAHTNSWDADLVSGGLSCR